MAPDKPGGTSPSEDPLFFADPAELRSWLEQNHQRCDVQWIGFYKKATGIPSITWPESVDQALCFGWIDGLRKSIDDQRYMIRFTPRRKRSHWSTKNLKRMPELLEAGQVHEAGRAVYESRDRKKERLASYEQKQVALPDQYQDRIRANPTAWEYFEASPPSYRKQVTWWIVSAKRESTRLRRLQVLIDACEDGTVIPPMRWSRKS